jgi:hypothetical protein
MPMEMPDDPEVEDDYKKDKVEDKKEGETSELDLSEHLKELEPMDQILIEALIKRLTC